VLLALGVPVVAILAEPIVAGPVPVVAAQFDVAATLASAVVVEHARIGRLTGFTAGVEGFNPGHNRLKFLI
jgi:hypothetical protein